MPQVLKNVAVEGPKERAVSKDVLDAVAAKTAALADRGRVLIRPSGTEPVVRVMVEGEDVKEVNAVADELVEVVGAG